ncbi:hypothetical protein CDD83_485 [Cordyceps sp. RAO-2017]|nr:hypothetical protein CDD83_485 [Cordyceps sp. RAO-2017]
MTWCGFVAASSGASLRPGVLDTVVVVVGLGEEPVRLDAASADAAGSVLAAAAVAMMEMAANPTTLLPDTAAGNLLCQSPAVRQWANERMQRGPLV